MSVIQVRPLKILYCLIGILIVLCSGYIVGLLVMHIWHKAPQKEKVGADTSMEETLYKAMIEGLEKENNGASYKNFDEAHRRYDFHKAKTEAIPDSQNLCISCHGDIPHYQNKRTRAFLNMHAFFMACETCHIRCDSRMETRFVWYEKRTGKEHEKIDLNRFLENTPFKLTPVKRDGTRIYATEQMVNSVARFKSEVKGMVPAEKKATLKAIHKPMTEVKNFVTCEECHKSDGHTAYLPYKQIGYPQRRTNRLVGDEVVGMIDKYKEFYLPNFLIPKGEAGSDE